MATLEQYVLPHYLYRYRSLKRLDQELDAIERNYLYGAAYRDLNDPMEGEFRSSRRLRNSGQYETVLKTIRDNKEAIGLCSFSEVHDNEVMWTHYANGFRGICIQYNLRRLLDSTGASIAFVRMYYNDVVPMLSNVHRDLGSAARMVLSCKTYRWLYEREWRMFGELGANRYRSERAVTKVFLGARMSEPRKRRIRRMAQSRGIDVEDMSIHAYTVDFESVDF
jgi:hypothetical protein